MKTLRPSTWEKTRFSSSTTCTPPAVFHTPRSRCFRARVSLAIKPYIYGEMLVLNDAHGLLRRELSAQCLSLRVNSYIDATTVHVAGVRRPSIFPSLVESKLAKDPDRDLTRRPPYWDAGPDDSGAFAEWDKWVADRVAQRTAAMADVMKEAGLTSPLPGLAGMKGQGTFFACAPYGTCWQPAATDDPQQSAAKLSRSRPSRAARWRQPAHLVQVKLRRPAQLSMQRS